MGRRWKDVGPGEGGDLAKATIEKESSKFAKTLQQGRRSPPGAGRRVQGVRRRPRVPARRHARLPGRAVSRGGPAHRDDDRRGVAAPLGGAPREAAQPLPRVTMKPPDRAVPVRAGGAGPRRGPKRRGRRQDERSCPRRHGSHEGPGGGGRSRRGGGGGGAAVAVSRSSSGDSAPPTTTPADGTTAAAGTTPASGLRWRSRRRSPPEPTTRCSTARLSTTDTVSEPVATDDGPALTTEDRQAAADGYTPPGLPGPTWSASPRATGHGRRSIPRASRSEPSTIRPTTTAPRPSPSRRAILTS